MLEIDGSYGEGGGQILRSALALSLATGTPFRVAKIRSGRSRPGLLRQHLASVRAAAEISGAEVSGAELGSTSLAFRPGALRAGEYALSIGSAGSTTLVLQTVLPPLLFAPGTTSLRLEGGTHNPSAPPYEFLERVFFAALRRLGFDVEARLERHGFYPAGGGVLRVVVRGGGAAAVLDQTASPGELALSARVLVANLPRSVAAREAQVVSERLGLDRARIAIEEVPSPGPGNAVLLEATAGDRVCEIATGFGEKGVRAEQVAGGAADAMRRYVDAGAPVGEHLADQLLLPMALGAGGAFRTAEPSSHLRTNAWVLERFLGDGVVRIEGDAVTVRGAAGAGTRR
jgi:RNA 3'-terminal phosphate cyclase (ATP)